MTTSLQATPELAAVGSTPGQTVGPFFHDALRWLASGVQTNEPMHGSISIEGTVEDGSGAPLPAWLIEAWVPQAVEVESRAGLAAPGFRRLMNGPEGKFLLAVPPPAPGQPAAFITLFGLGLTRHHCTAVFLRDPAPAEPVTDGGENAFPVDAIPADRRATLVAERIDERRYRWTIRTQGARETVFFDYR